MSLCKGDLIFWCSAERNDSESLFEDAVSAVGGGPDEPFHVSLVVDNAHVVHAVTDGVCQEALSDVRDRFLKTFPKLKIVTASLSISDDVKAKAVSFAISKIGLPYNDTFLEERADRNEAYYCCQLIRKAYLAFDNKIKFPMRPLNFRDTNKKPIPYWVDYYRERGLDVPETEIGSHPADLLKSDIVKILSTSFVANKL